MMPGRSLSVNTTGRSCAPAATAWRARMRQTRWRLSAAGAARPRWSVRRSSARTNPSSYARRGGALQVQHVGIGGQLGDRGRDPVQGGRAVDGVGGAQQGAAGLTLLVDQHHPGAGARRGQRRGQARRAAPTTNRSACACLAS